MCLFESSHKANIEITDLQARIHQHISPELLYSVRFWMKHLSKSSIDEVEVADYEQRVDMQSLANTVGSFLASTQSLYWLEMLSLAERLREGRDALIEFEHLSYSSVSTYKF